MEIVKEISLVTGEQATLENQSRGANILKYLTSR